MVTGLTTDVIPNTLPTEMRSIVSTRLYFRRVIHKIGRYACKREEYGNFALTGIVSAIYGTI